MFKTLLLTFGPLERQRPSDLSYLYHCAHQFGFSFIHLFFFWMSIKSKWTMTESFEAEGLGGMGSLNWIWPMFCYWTSVLGMDCPYTVFEEGGPWAYLVQGHFRLKVNCNFVIILSNLWHHVLNTWVKTEVELSANHHLVLHVVSSRGCITGQLNPNK